MPLHQRCNEHSGLIRSLNNMVIYRTVKDFEYLRQTRHEKQDRYDIVTFLDVIVTLSSLRNAIVLFVSSLCRL